MTRRRFLALCAAVLGGALLGCTSQRIKHYEFYEPTKDTIHQREDGYFVGALKAETTRDGSRDEGDKSFCFGIFNFK